MPIFSTTSSIAGDTGPYGTALAYQPVKEPTQAMLKIVSVANGSGTAILVLEGRLIGPWVEELRRSCEQAFGSTERLTLDLGMVSFIERAGIELLRSLADRHARLNNCSPFVAEQLRTPER